MPWWGDRGPAPHLEWPGRTIDIPCVWSKARSRWESPDGRFYFDAEAADRAVRFFPTFLVHHIGEFAGQAFELLEYQKKLLTRPLFGWKHARTKLRRFKKIFAFLPKGAGKSPWGAGTGLYLTAFDNEPAAEVYAVAGDREQARVVHENAKVFVESSEDLAEYFGEVLKDAIPHPVSRSTYKVLSSDASTKHGFRPHGVIFDEMHAQPNRDLYEALRKSMAKRRQPVMVIITHSGTDDEGICYEEYEYAKAVLEGLVDDPATLPVIFEMRPGEDWTDPAVWASVNPGHGITIQHDAIEQECREAMAEPRKRNDFLRYHLNVWTNQAEAWIPVEWWDSCPSQLDEERLKSLVCAGGLDMAQKIDLASFTAVFKEPLQFTQQTIEVVADTPAGDVEKREVSLNYRLHFLSLFWIPENTMQEREKVDRVPYSEWKEKGFVIATEGDVIDDDRIFKDIVKLAERFPLLKQAEIGYDPAFATSIALRLQAKGFIVREVLQNYKYMSEPCQIVEALMKAGRISHDGNRCMRRCVENVAIKTDDAGRIRPVKPKKQSKRIDGMVSALIGTNRVIVAPEPGSRYVEGGLVTA